METLHVFCSKFHTLFSLKKILTEVQTGRAGHFFETQCSCFVMFVRCQLFYHQRSDVVMRSAHLSMSVCPVRALSFIELA